MRRIYSKAEGQVKTATSGSELRAHVRELPVAQAPVIKKYSLIQPMMAAFCRFFLKFLLRINYRWNIRVIFSDRPDEQGHHHDAPLASL
ncbi:MAG: hypothetical protein R3B47_17920 [Bacteroidia bacterium]